VSDNIRRINLFVALLVSLSAMIITLYSSVVTKIPVCDLCWYQRICIYPLVIIIGIACFRDDFKVWVYGLPLALLGTLFGIYQYLQQMISSFSPIKLCGTGPACDSVHLSIFGFITYPFLSVIACIAISILLLIAGRKAK